MVLNYASEIIYVDKIITFAQQKNKKKNEQSLIVKSSLNGYIVWFFYHWIWIPQSQVQIKSFYMNLQNS